MHEIIKKLLCNYAKATSILISCLLLLTYCDKGEHYSGSADSRAEQESGPRVESKPSNAKPDMEDTGEGELKKNESSKGTSKEASSYEALTEKRGSDRQQETSGPQPLICYAPLQQDSEYLCEWNAGSSYVGPLQGAYPHGKGLLRFANGMVYRGEFQFGIRQGEGSLVYPDGKVCSGHFYSNQLYGNVKCVFPSGDIYEGPLTAYNQSGIYRLADGSIYRGGFRLGERTGFGVVRSNEGEVLYRGTFRNNEPHGRGWLRLANDSIYTGPVKNGKPDGYGRIEDADGTVYVGPVEAGKRNGKGLMTMPDGRTYKGDFSNNMVTGCGVYRWPDGRSYEGDFVQGIPHGKGKLVMADGKTYIGEFQNGLANGQGTLLSPEGEILKQGIFKDFKYIGPGRENPESTTTGPMCLAPN